MSWLNWLKQVDPDFGEQHASLLHEDDEGMYWEFNNKKQRIDWARKLSAMHPRDLYKSKHLLLRSIWGKRTTPPFVLDGFAGMGADGYLMVYSGCQVLSCETKPAVFAILKDAYNRVYERSHSNYLSKWCMMPQNVFDLIKSWPRHRVRPDVVYLDPMFKVDFRGQVKQYAWLLNQIGDQTVPQNVLQVALNFAIERVVVKRSIKSGFVDDKKPTYSISGKTIRYDIYQVR